MIIPDQFTKMALFSNKRSSVPSQRLARRYPLEIPSQQVKYRNLLVVKSWQSLGGIAFC
ncbi:MAG: hypothetical protein ACI92E_000830 [Oceanicoccus sp.]|jgi:hypothetical protein